MVGSMDFLKVDLRDLQSLLRKKLGNDLNVVKYKSESLLPFGENYGSTILKVHAVVKRENEENEEELDLVAKMLPVTEFQRLLFDSSNTFKKEAFLYEQLIPSYQLLEREFGIGEDDVFDIVPKFYGARFSLRSDKDFDEDAVILMQNLKSLGYYLLNRREGLNFPHAKAVITALARFHALGMALKNHRPDFFEIVKQYAKCMEMTEEVKDMEHRYFLDVMRNDLEMSLFFDQIERAMKYTVGEAWTDPPTEPWATIIHADFWVNNVMFKKGSENNDPVGVKFVDFQNYLFLSPLRELIFFAMTSFSNEVIERDFDELLDHYHHTFVSVLRRMKCDVQEFTRDKFNDRLKIDAIQEFSHIPFMLKIVTKSVETEATEQDVQSLLTEKEVNPVLLKRLRRLVKKYAEKGWFR